jgi:hypothetical protein
MDKMLVCTRCKKYKFRENFPDHIATKQWCRECRSESDRKYRFNLDQDRFVSLLESQNGVCAICHNPETRRSLAGDVVELSVDHDHACCPGRNSCGKCIRGLLCERCNRSIGLFEEDADLLTSAITYIRSYTTNDSSSNRRYFRRGRFSRFSAKVRRLVG